ncbi:MAG: hypothetical protein WC022_04205 [Parcubacteria group bacterium]
MEKGTTNNLIDSSANGGDCVGGGCFPPIGGVRRAMAIICE